MAACHDVAGKQAEPVLTIMASFAILVATHEGVSGIANPGALGQFVLCAERCRRACRAM